MKNADKIVAVIGIILASGFLGYLLGDYLCKVNMDKQGIKKTFGLFQG
jgi:hypothetical protein